MDVWLAADDYCVGVLDVVYKWGSNIAPKRDVVKEKNMKNSIAET